MIRHTKKWKVTVCGSFIYRTICPIYLFSSDSLNCAASIVRARYSTNSYLNQGITKRSYTFIFAKFSHRQRNPLMKNFKTKKKYLDHLDNFNSPLPLQPSPRAGPRVRYYCLRCSFWLLVVVRHFSPFLCLSWFLSVWKYPNALVNSIAMCCI